MATAMMDSMRDLLISTAIAVALGACSSGQNGQCGILGCPDAGPGGGGADASSNDAGDGGDYGPSICDAGLGDCCCAHASDGGSRGFCICSAPTFKCGQPAPGDAGDYWSCGVCGGYEQPACGYDPANGPYPNDGGPYQCADPGSVPKLPVGCVTCGYPGSYADSAWTTPPCCPSDDPGTGPSGCFAELGGTICLADQTGQNPSCYPGCIDAQGNDPTCARCGGANQPCCLPASNPSSRRCKGGLSCVGPYPAGQYLCGGH